MNFEQPAQESLGLQEPLPRQSVADVAFIDVGESGDVDNDEVLTISLSEQERGDQNAIRARLFEAASGRYWWLREYWQGKEAHEQITVTVSGKTVEIYNFNERPLSAEHLAGISRVVARLADCKDRVLLDGVDCIAISDEDDTNPKSGELRRGELSLEARMIALTPAGMRFGDYRGLDINNFEAVLSHEYAHVLASSRYQGIHQDLIHTEWKALGGWRYEPRTLPGGQGSLWINDELERLPTEYAAHDFYEDFCESVAVYLQNPALLDESRREFLQERIFSDGGSVVDQKESSDVAMKRMAGSAVTLPRIEQIKYQVKAHKSVKSIRRNS